MRLILEAQEYKTKKQYAEQRASCHSKHGGTKSISVTQGWFHIGYLRIVFKNREDASSYVQEWKQSSCSLNLRLIIREYSDEYLNIDKPYYENIERLRSCKAEVQRRVAGERGYMLERQVRKDWYVSLASKGEKSVTLTGVGNWCHLSYCDGTYLSREEATDAIHEKSERDREELGDEASEMILYVVRECYGEVRDAVHTYEEYKQKSASSLLPVDALVRPRPEGVQIPREVMSMPICVTRV